MEVFVEALTGGDLLFNALIAGGFTGAYLAGDALLARRFGARSDTRAGRTDVRSEEVSGRVSRAAEEFIACDARYRARQRGDELDIPAAIRAYVAKRSGNPRRDIFEQPRPYRAAESYIVAYSTACQRGMSALQDVVAATAHGTAQALHVRRQDVALLGIGQDLVSVKGYRDQTAPAALRPARTGRRLHLLHGLDAVAEYAGASDPAAVILLLNAHSPVADIGYRPRARLRARTPLLALQLGDDPAVRTAVRALRRYHPNTTVQRVRSETLDGAVGGMRQLLRTAAAARN